MESITLNITYRTDKTKKQNDISSFKILKKYDKETNNYQYMLICYNDKLECLPGPEVYKKYDKGVDYIVGTNKYYNEGALPLIIVGDDSKYEFINEGYFKNTLAILNKGQEPPYINFEDIIYMNLIFDNEKKMISFDRNNPNKLIVSTSMVIDDNLYNDINLKENNEKEEILNLNDVLEQAILTMDYFDTFKRISKSFGQWHAKERRK